MRRRRGTMLGSIFVVAVLVIVLFAAGQKVSSDIDAGNARIAELQEQTDNENDRTKEIESMQEDIQSDSYKEQVAKDKLGMIKKNEIIFKEADDTSSVSN